MASEPVAHRDVCDALRRTGPSNVRWTTRASGFYAVRPLIKLMDGWMDGWMDGTFAGLRRIGLDIDRIVTVGRCGPLGEPSSWAESPDLGKVDEVGFVDLMPGSGHGSRGICECRRV